MITLEHKELLKIYKTNVFSNISSFVELEQSITNVVKTLNQNNADDIKGATFEIFSEFLLKKLGESTQMGVYDITTTSDDKYFVGTDFYGTGLDGTSFQIQAKYKTKHTSKLQLNDLGSFFTRAFAESTIHKNLLVLTNVFHSTDNSAIHYTIENIFTEANSKCRVFGRDQIIETTSYQKFWTDFQESITNSVPKEKTRTYLDPNKFQLKALAAAINDKPRTQILMPTGSGKTLVESMVADDCIKKGGQIVVVIAPRIALVSQLCSVFQAQSKTTWEPIIVSSGEKEDRELYDDQSHDGYIEPSTKSADIKNNIINGLKKGSVIIFSTNHSAKKINRIVNSLNKTIALGIGDEAHNFTSEDFRKTLEPTVLAVDKWRFFTATRKIDDTGNGRGMNNKEYFGEVVYSVPPSEVIRAGLIVPPRLQYVKYDPETDFDFNPDDDEEYRVEMAMMVAGITQHIKTCNNKDTRVIVFCSGATEAHRFAKSDIVLEKFPNAFTAAITAKSTTMNRIEGRSNRTKRTEIFSKFSSSKQSILFHYDVVSEGIDLPGATAIIPLRPLGEIKSTQGTGRVLRICDVDRINLKKGIIKIGDPTNWEKPFGYVILPYISKHNENDMTRIERIVFSLREAEYDFDCETLQVEHTPKGEEDTGVKFDEYDTTPTINVDGPEEFVEHTMLTLNDIKDIENKIDQKIEDEKDAIECARIGSLSEEDLFAEFLGE
jgi:superfamily II DNA or RNA helicase